MEVILKVEPKIYKSFWYGLWYPIQGYQRGNSQGWTKNIRRLWYGLWYPIQGYQRGNSQGWTKDIRLLIWIMISGYQLPVVMVDLYKLTYLRLLNLKTGTYL